MKGRLRGGKRILISSLAQNSVSNRNMKATFNIGKIGGKLFEDCYHANLEDKDPGFQPQNQKDRK